MAWFPTAPAPPSEATEGEAYDLRFPGNEDPSKPVQKGHGNLYVLGVVAALAVVLIGSAVVLALRAQSEVQITLSGVHTEMSPFDYDGTPEYGFRTVSHSFFLANAGPATPT